jgi:hypothetical protein
MSTGSVGGTLAVRIQPPSSGSGRYTDGAPVVIWVPGGFETKGLRHELPSNADDLVIITFAFPGDTVPDAAISSDGVYDYRGENCILALRDVILFAAGELADEQGRMIDDILGIHALSTNIGLIGVSNGGNIIIAVAALHGDELVGRLRYAIQWETPVSSQIATRDFGRIWLKPSSQQGDFFNPRFAGYGTYVFAVDYDDLAYDPSNTYYSVFHDGNSDRVYTALENPNTRVLIPDLNRDGLLTLDEDFPLDTYPGGDGSLFFYSRPVAQALSDRGLLPHPWPEQIATPQEADAYWDIRESVRLYEQALANIPDLEGMVLGSVEDHVQSAPTKIHLRQAFDGWYGAGEWVQINPSPAYLVEAAPSLEGRADLPDMQPNTAPEDWADTSAYCIQEDIPDAVYQLAAVWQMADRVQEGQFTDGGQDSPGLCRGTEMLIGLGVCLATWRRRVKRRPA